MEEKIEELTEGLKCAAECIDELEALEIKFKNEQERIGRLCSEIIKNLHRDDIEQVLWSIVEEYGISFYVDALRRAQVMPAKVEYEWIINELNKNTK